MSRLARALPVQLRYDIPRSREHWTLTEDKVPQARPHDLEGDRIEDQLTPWARRVRPTALVGRELAVRWDEDHPRVGIDPDVYLVDPGPPEGDDVTSLRLWETGHYPPQLAVEVVSPNHPTKDYTTTIEKYAASGIGELWVFDPKLAGPKSGGGPQRIQIWVRDEDDAFERVYAGDGPVRSPFVGAWLFAVNEGQRLRIADDEAGTQWWMTDTEAERAAKQIALAEKEAERAAKQVALAEKDAERAAKQIALAEKDAERAAKQVAVAEKDAALARIAELEAELERRRGNG